MTPWSRLDLEALADTGGHLEGRFDAAALDPRLAGALDRDEVTGEVRYALDFQRLANGEVGVRGAIRARLGACCQRCLEPFELQVSAGPRLQVSSTDERAEPEEGWEPGDPDPSPTLGALIEDELLLALPLSPRHPEADCPVSAAAGAVPKTDTQRPFTGLARALAERDGRKD
ncbi:MAG: YceD family protein [Gammaproteobacteria bacterium]|nr:YceD family protein [Gammaproteobacteria bacterium]